jgi:hypothetical protein
LHQIFYMMWFLIFNYRDNNTPPSTPERVRAAAQQNEREQRVLDSPEHHRTPHHIRITRNNNQIPPALPQFTYLPANLAEQFAALPPLNPVGQRGRGRGRGRQAPAPAFGLAPAFQLAPAAAPAAPAAPAPAPATLNYQYLPAHLAQQLAALPSLPQRGRVRRNIPPVCLSLIFFKC